MCVIEKCRGQQAGTNEKNERKKSASRQKKLDEWKTVVRREVISSFFWRRKNNNFSLLGFALKWKFKCCTEDKWKDFPDFTFIERKFVKNYFYNSISLNLSKHQLSF